MIDDDDVEFTALAWPEGGLFVILLGFAVLILMCVVVSQNKDECAQRRCRTGSAVLLNHECLCVEKPESK